MTHAPAKAAIRLLFGAVLYATAMTTTQHAQTAPPALPQVFQPFAGDPRLEPLPADPVHLVNVEVFTTDQFGVEKRLMMRFPPRVNGQNESDGDKHADLFVLFDATTHKQIDQPVILEAVPKNAASGLTVSDRKAREFSPVWELHAVMVDSSYNPNVPEQRIDSVEKVETSPLVKEIIQTNIFLNCPVVPNGSTVAPGFVQPEPAFFEGQLVTIVPYDTEDGEFNVQILFKFEDADGFVLGRAADGTPARSKLESPGFTPHLVASHALGDPFYTPIWEVWTVKVPNGTDVSTIRSGTAVRQGVTAGTFKVRSSGIRLNCPVVQVDGVPVPFEDAFDILAARDTAGTRTFERGRFPLDLGATAFFKPRTFQITEITPGAGLAGPPAAPPAPGAGSAFPLIDPDDKGNVVPLILRDPFGPSNSSGDFIRIDQAKLDAAFANNNPPRLPAAIEANFTALINEGLLAPEWAPGGRPYQERLALVGKALFKLLWTPEQGANQKDVTTCRACHSQPSDGASSRGLYTLERAIVGRPEIGSQTNAGSMFGSGAAELLVSQLKAAGASITFAHGTQGQIASIRDVVVGASNTHFGIEAVERIASLANVDIPTASTLDLDKDGVTNELTVGEVTAETVFLMTTQVPDRADDEVVAMLGISQQSVQQGSRLFRRAIADGGIGCASCHTPFHPLRGTQFVLTNPQTAVALTLEMPYHTATQEDVNEGLAAFVSQPGLRTFGDFKRHEMGPAMFANDGSIMKTAELWDVGSDAPLLRNGSLGSDIDSAIRAHGGEGQASTDAYAALSADSQKDVVNFLRVQLVQGKVGEGSGARPPFPTTTRFEENASAVAYTGTWAADLLPSFSGGRAVLSTEAGAKATLTFTGTSVTWIAYRDRWSGIARVYVDGALQATVDTYSLSDTPQAVMYTASALSAGTHTLVIEVTGSRNPSSRGAWVWVDAFDVLSTGRPPAPAPAATPAHFEENASAVAYTGTWAADLLPSFSAGRAVLSTEAGAKATLTFTGTSVTWIAYRDRWSGIARVYVDGALQATVDTYSLSDTPQAVMYMASSLSTGTHTLVIEVTGSRNPSSGGAWVWVDAFDTH